MRVYITHKLSFVRQYLQTFSHLNIMIALMVLKSARGVISKLYILYGMQNPTGKTEENGIVCAG